MDVFLYIMIFIMGTFFGSFFTLAVYRIPLKKDITHEHSFCPNCNHKLGVFDLVPVFSYLFLRGKCRYCGEKVRIRYLLLEILSGIVFLVAYISLNIQNIYFDYSKLIDFVFFVFMYVTVVLVAGIDKEYRKINVSVLVFGGICQAVYILYLYVIGDASMYRYSIYFAIFVLLFIINMILQKKKESYFPQIMLFCGYIMAVLGAKNIGIIIVLSAVVVAILPYVAKKKYNSLDKIPVGFVIGIFTIVCEIVENFMEFYII